MVVKIRYSDLPSGLHVSVERRGRSTIIYLLPGLTADQRHAALTRVRSSGRVGQGPRLPAISMALAVAEDRLRMTVRNGAAAMRGHPVLLLPPLILLVSAAIVFVLMSFVTLTVRPPAAAGPDPSEVFHGRGLAHRHGSASRPAGTTGALRPAPGSPTPGQPSPSATPSGRPSPSAPDPTSSAPSAPPPSSSPTPTISSSGPDPSPSASASPSPSSSPSPTPDPSSSGVCLKLGPLGLCVDL
jgi:hypothetical protein